MNIKIVIASLLLILSLVGCTSIEKENETCSLIHSVECEDAISELNELQKTLQSTQRQDIQSPKQTREELNLYNYVLTTDDFDSELYPIWSEMQEANELVLSELRYSRAKRNEYNSAYSVYYGSNWNWRINSYDYQFREYIYSFQDETYAKSMFKDLTSTYFTGYLDDVGDDPKYDMTSTKTMRTLKIRRAFNNEDFNIVDVVIKEGNFVLDISMVYSLNDYEDIHHEMIVSKAIERVRSPLKNEKDIGKTYKEYMDQHRIDHYQNEKFSILLNDVRINATGPPIGTLEHLTVTVQNKNSYPFYPAVSYEVKRTLEKNPSMTAREFGEKASNFDNGAKWTIYSDSLLDTGQQMTFHFPYDTQIGINEDNTTTIIIELLDIYKGGATTDRNDAIPVKIDFASFDINISDYNKSPS